MPSRVYGSIIGLRPEFEQRYRVLHRHVFPGVLDRIARSNIRNYSIYLGGTATDHLGDEGTVEAGRILFGHFEHVGTDYDADMAAMAGDETTREWWQLTDPMQVPLDERAPGEWWARLEAVYDFDSRQSQSQTRSSSRRPGRCAWVTPAPALVPAALEAALGRVPGVEVLRIFRSRGGLYVYVECDETARAGVATAVTAAFALPSPPVEIEEVFHTDLDPPRRQAAGRGPHAARKKVFVSGCFDLLHSGHIAFLEEAARHGDLYVGIGSDATIHRLKGRYTINSQDERKYMISALGCVTECRVNRGTDFLDFEEDLQDLRPDLLVVNEDGHSPAKEALCRTLGIEYKVLQRIPHAGLPPRATTTLRTESRIPFRIDLAGGWLDQPFVSCHCAGPVLTVSIEPTIEFNDRSGMASSTRRKAIDLWHTSLPHTDPEQLARVLFSYENPPGTTEVAGSQDALGIVLPGLNRLHYEGSYWPSTIESVHDEAVLSWLEDRLHLVTLGPRVSSFRVLDDVRVDAAGARALADAAEACWRAILARDAAAFGRAFTRSFEAQVAMFPLMVDPGIREAIAECRDGALGWKLSGAGGGGYVILVSEAPVPNTVGVKIRRRGTE
jgi:cytidyltransferase-like protein